MRARRDVEFYECFDCQTATMLHNPAVNACPVCGSQNGQIVSCAQLGQRIEAAGGIVHIDLSPSVPIEPKPR